jgi:hypothetical protein
VPPTPRIFGQAIGRALGPGSSQATRRAAAEEALRISAGWQDARTGFALLTLSRLSGPGEAERAIAACAEAAAIFRARGLELHTAHAEMQLAVFALAGADWETADLLASRSLPATIRDQNASLMAGLMMVRSQALERLGKPDQAAKLLLDSLGWARYGMASDEDVRRRLGTISAIAARTEQNSQ